LEEIMIEVSNVTFSYRGGDFRIEIPKLEIEAGEKVAVIGPSGRGKTTLLHLLAGVLVPSAGSISVAGTEVSALPREDRQDYRALRMGMVFQEFELLEYLDVLDNVLLPYRISPVLTLDDKACERAGALVQEVGLSGERRRYPRHLSQGERQRIAVCRALVTRPAILLGDEPTGNLDPDNRDHIMDTLCRYSDETKAPLVVVTHDHELLGRFDRTIDVSGFSP
jgi:putative ABC transport system ATP-binding protein